MSIFRMSAAQFTCASYDLTSKKCHNMSDPLNDDDDEAHQMKTLGLPSQFATSKNQKFHRSKQSSRQSSGGNDLTKYRKQKYRLFHRFDEGILLDTESWYSVTPEPIARHIAERCAELQPSVVVDACCGAGGNSIQFALHCPTAHILAIDIDPEKIRLSQNNARVYGVDHRIDFIVADFMQIARSGRLAADVVFLSPQWGGPEYMNRFKSSLDHMTPNGRELIRIVRQFMTSNIIFLLPRNMDLSELQELACEPFGQVEVETNCLSGRAKTMTAYFGQLIRQNSEAE